MLVSLGSCPRRSRAVAAPAASGYLTPPKAIVDILDAPPPPTVELSGSGTAMAVLERASMPTMAELAQPMLRLAGVRINPKTNGLHRAVRYRSLTLKNPADGTERKVTLPANSGDRLDRLFAGQRKFAFTQHSRHRHRAVGGRHRDRRGQGDHASAVEQRARIDANAGTRASG